MSAQGSTTINFGSFPGTTDASVTITGQSNIQTGSLVNAWILPAATTDHSIDEHWVDPPIIFAGNIVAGTGFTIYGVINDENFRYGQWTVAWVWN